MEYIASKKRSAQINIFKKKIHQKNHLVSDFWVCWGRNQDIVFQGFPKIPEIFSMIET